MEDNNSIMPSGQSIIRDGVEIPLPTTEELPKFKSWLEKNGDRDPYHPAQHYDLLGAFRSGLNRVDEKGEPSPIKRDPKTGEMVGGHLPDTFKLPGHPTFSTESKYYKKNMPAGTWEGGKYIPINR